jgi:hypothetical protein
MEVHPAALPLHLVDLAFAVVLATSLKGEQFRILGSRCSVARRGVESSARLGRHRWRLERLLSWLSCWRRLQVRWDRDAGRWFAFVLLACAVVCFNRL